MGSSVATNIQSFLWAMLTMGDAVHVSLRGLWEISVLPFQFYYEPKTVLKNTFGEPQSNKL